MSHMLEAVRVEERDGGSHKRRAPRHSVHIRLPVLWQTFSVQKQSKRAHFKTPQEQRRPNLTPPCCRVCPRADLGEDREAGPGKLPVPSVRAAEDQHRAHRSEEPHRGEAPWEGLVLHLRDLSSSAQLCKRLPLPYARSSQEANKQPINIVTNYKPAPINDISEIPYWLMKFSRMS